ncbi:MAG: hypothetical protein WBV46_09010 [Terriglobales bacterium]
MRIRLLPVILISFFCASFFAANLGAGTAKNGPAKDHAAKYPPETRNAALRYWMAFAEMQDTWADKATQDLLEKTAAGDAPWDEGKLAPILDANADAISVLQRATKLPDCDWGLEYGRGWKASIAYAPRARALARLNTLEGMRQLAKGNSQSAVNTWLAGIRLSQDLTHGGSLIFALMAKNVLLPDLRLLAQAARNGQLSEAEKKQVFAVVRAMPEDAFDWASAWGLESVSIEDILRELQAASDADATYEAIMSKPAPKQGLPPTAEDIHAFREYMLVVEGALREPPAQAAPNVGAIQTKLQKLGEVERSMAPNPQGVNTARIEVTTARADLLRALGVK